MTFNLIIKLEIAHLCSLFYFRIILRVSVFFFCKPLYYNNILYNMHMYIYIVIVIKINTGKLIEYYYTMLEEAARAREPLPKCT